MECLMIHSGLGEREEKQFPECFKGYGYPQEILFCHDCGSSGLMGMLTRCNTASCPIKKVSRDKAL